MKIIRVDNYDRESVDDVLIAENVDRSHGESMVEFLNKNRTSSEDYYRLVEDDYTLYRREGSASAMTLDDAIAHAEEVAQSHCNKCAREHGQLAKWLKELKRYKESDMCHVSWEHKRAYCVLRIKYDTGDTVCAGATYCSVCGKILDRKLMEYVPCGYQYSRVLTNEEVLEKYKRRKVFTINSNDEYVDLTNSR